MPKTDREQNVVTEAAMMAFVADLPLNDPKLKEASELAKEIMEIEPDDFGLGEIHGNRKNYLKIFSAYYDLLNLHRIISQAKSPAYQRLEICFRTTMAHYEYACRRFGIIIAV